MTLINKYGQFPTKQQILELCKTPEGKKEVFDYVCKARSAMSAQRIMEHLDLSLTEQQQWDLCTIIFDTCFRYPVDRIFDYVVSIEEVVEKKKEETIYEC